MLTNRHIFVELHGSCWFVCGAACVSTIWLALIPRGYWAVVDSRGSWWELKRLVPVRMSKRCLFTLLERFHCLDMIGWRVVWISGWVMAARIVTILFSLQGQISGSPFRDTHQLKGLLAMLDWSSLHWNNLSNHVFQSGRWEVIHHSCLKAACCFGRGTLWGTSFQVLQQPSTYRRIREIMWDAGMWTSINRRTMSILQDRSWCRSRSESTKRYAKVDLPTTSVSWWKSLLSTWRSELRTMSPNWFLTESSRQGLTDPHLVEFGQSWMR